MELQEFKQAVRKEMDKDFRACRRNEIDEDFNSSECLEYIESRYTQAKSQNLDLKKIVSDVSYCLRFMYQVVKKGKCELKTCYLVKHKKMDKLYKDMKEKEEKENDSKV